MSWKDSLKSASFRGVPFKYLDTETRVGRRNIIHEFPYKTEPYVEDMGRRARVYNITAYVIQNPSNEFDYFRERDALIEAFEAEGSGTLVHPFHGSKSVAVRGEVTVSESFLEGGIARFNVTFVEDSGKIAVEEEQPDTAEVLIEVCAVAEASFLSRLVSAYQTVQSKISGYVSMITGAISTVQGVISGVQSAVVSTITGALNTISNSRDGIQSIINAPSAIGDAISNTFDSFSSIMGDKSDNDGGQSVVYAALELTKFGETIGSADASAFGGTLPASPGVPTDQAHLIIETIRCFGLSSAIKASASVEFRNTDEAQAMLTALSDAMDITLEYISTHSASPEAYDAVMSMRGPMVAALLAKGAALPPVFQYEIGAESVPAVVVAYRQYGDITRETDLISRNRIKLLNPLFCPAGDTIEVQAK